MVTDYEVLNENLKADRYQEPCTFLIYTLGKDKGILYLLRLFFQFSRLMIVVMLYYIMIIVLCYKLAPTVNVNIQNFSSKNH